MYSSYVHQSRTIAEWSGIFGGEYTEKQLFRLARCGYDFAKLFLRR